LQHRAQDYCGLGLYDGKKAPQDYSHRGLVRSNFTEERLSKLSGFNGIGCVSSERQPIAELSRSGGYIVAFDGNILNHAELKERLLREGASFSGYHSPEEVNDIGLISKVIASEPTFFKGVEKLVELMKGDFAIVALTKEGVYAARGWGRKPLILGKNDYSYVVSSESNPFANLDIEIRRDVEPGEVVFLDRDGINRVGKLDLSPVKFGTFEWIYTAYPPSIIDRKPVSEVRWNLGKCLAKRFPVEADFISPIPRSGTWHSFGYSAESKIPSLEVFTKYDFSGRSFTPATQEARDMEAKTKLIPVERFILGQRIVIVDDSIVRGTQMLNRVKVLKELGAREVHARIACPPLMSACPYGKTTRKDDDCIARRMDLNGIQEKLGLDSLCYATIEDLEEAIGLPREKLCLECWETTDCFR
jgi:amidophosphoribosyltransferase